MGPGEAVGEAPEMLGSSPRRIPLPTSPSGPAGTPRGGPSAPLQTPRPTQENPGVWRVSTASLPESPHPSSTTKSNDHCPSNAHGRPGRANRGRRRVMGSGAVPEADRGTPSGPPKATVSGVVDCWSAPPVGLPRRSSRAGQCPGQGDEACALPEGECLTACLTPGPQSGSEVTPSDVTVRTTSMQVIT
jgi:hypothetical protein